MRHKAPLSACKAGENTPGRSPQPATAFSPDRDFDISLWRCRSLLLFLRLHFARLMDRWTGSRGVRAAGDDQRAATGTLTGSEWREGCLRPGRRLTKRPGTTKPAPKVWNRARFQGTFRWPDNSLPPRPGHNPQETAAGDWGCFSAPPFLQVPPGVTTVLCCCASSSLARMPSSAVTPRA